MCYKIIRENGKTQMHSFCGVEQHFSFGFILVSTGFINVGDHMEYAEGVFSSNMVCLNASSVWRGVHFWYIYRYCSGLLPLVLIVASFLSFGNPSRWVHQQCISRGEGGGGWTGIHGGIRLENVPVDTGIRDGTLQLGSRERIDLTE